MNNSNQPSGIAKHDPMFDYLLIQADSTLIHGHRLSELCSKGPALEIDIALSNIGLDFIGRARLYYKLAADYSPVSTDEDKLAYFRDEREYKNNLAVELPNRDFAYTIIKQYLLDEFHALLLASQCASNLDNLSGISGKAVKENAYHLMFSKQWVLRLGDGTEESHSKIQAALDYIFPYAFDLFSVSPAEDAADRSGIVKSPAGHFDAWIKNVTGTIKTATLNMPGTTLKYTGGKIGAHTEHLGKILSEMQHVQRAYPNLKW